MNVTAALLAKAGMVSMPIEARFESPVFLAICSAAGTTMPAHHREMGADEIWLNLGEGWMVQSDGSADALCPPAS